MPTDNSKHAERFMALFEGMAGASGTHGLPEWEPDKMKWTLKNTAITERTPVTLQLWEQHLSGKRPLGIIPIREDSLCLWGSIDVDIYDRPNTAIIDAALQRKFPLVPVRSKSGGLHLFLFLAQPLPAANVIACLRDMAASLGLSGSEIFPKQSSVLVERGDFGSWMVMPYYGDDYGGKLQEQVGLRKSGTELTAEEFLRAAEKARLTTEEFDKLVVTGGKRTPSQRDTKPSKGTAFSDGPPCLQHMAAQGAPSGGQNNTLMMMGIYYKKAFPEDWQAHLKTANDMFLDPPGSLDALQSATRSLEKKEYLYTCRTEPMRSHCNSAVCRTRRHGVGEEGNYPRISGLSKLNTEPAIWFVDVGDQRIEVPTENLQNYVKFHAVCMERINVTYRMMKQDDWLQVVAAAMVNVTVIAAPPDIANFESFREMLEDFLTNRQRGSSKEDILTGRPWEDEAEGRHYFRLQDLEKHLKREGDRDAKRGMMTRRIEKMGGGHKFMVIKNKGVNTWWVPSGAVSGTPVVGAKAVPGAEV